MLLVIGSTLGCSKKDQDFKHTTYIYATDIPTDRAFSLVVDDVSFGVIENIPAKPSLCDESSLLECIVVELGPGCHKFELIAVNGKDHICRHAISYKENRTANCSPTDDKVNLGPDPNAGHLLATVNEGESGESECLIELSSVFQSLDSFNTPCN